MPAAAPDVRALRLLAAGFFALCGATFCLIVLGALVRAHGAGLACPDWPLCFGNAVPAFDLRVGFEWTHRVVAGSVALLFAGLALAALRLPRARAACGRWLAAAAVLLATQIALGALTVWHLLASWTVTAHLIGQRLQRVRARDRAAAPAAQHRARGAGRRGARGWSPRSSASPSQLCSAASSPRATRASPAPRWPTCNWRRLVPELGGESAPPSTGATATSSCCCSVRARSRRRGVVGRALGLARRSASLQVVVGILNVRLGLPVEVTGLHSALAAGLVLSLAAAGVRSGS
jgi:cytochrome c oxidase assembly protein subunit 15